MKHLMAKSDFRNVDSFELEGSDREELAAWMLKLSNSTIMEDSGDKVVLNEEYTLIDFV
jgi:hypothetical protein